MKRLLIAIVAALSVPAVACEEDDATGLDPDLIPIEPRTVTVVLPWDDIGRGTELFRGFGSAADLNRGIVADDFGGSLEAKTLAFFRGFDDRVFVRRPEGGLVFSDSEFRGGRVVIKVRAADGSEDPTLIRARSITERWDAASATWELAIDSVGEARPWDVPGAGGFDQVGEVVFDPIVDEEEGLDSLVMPLDSAVIAELMDTTELARGLVLEADGPGARVAFSSVAIQLDLIPEVNPDTTVQVLATPPLLTAIFDPVPQAVDQEIIVGGAPGIRATLGVELPAFVDVPNPVCQQVICPLTLDPERLNVASLVFTTQQSEPALRPLDSLRLDFRAVLAPDRLPKSPMSTSFIVGPTGHVAIGPDAFDEEAGQEVPFPFTVFARDQLRGETSSGLEPPEVVVLLGFLEPTSFDVATFQGPGAPGAPFVRLVMTLADSVLIR